MCSSSLKIGKEGDVYTWLIHNQDSGNAHTVGPSHGDVFSHLVIY